MNDKANETAGAVPVKSDPSVATAMPPDKPEPGAATNTTPPTKPEPGAATSTTPPAKPEPGVATSATPPTKRPGSNRIGLVQADYKGLESTLCNGCGHDAISAHIIKACFELGIEQHNVAKMSGIGCSSKTPAYFLGRAHGFNAVHGRMPSVTTGASLANAKLTLLAVSGDGDTASIGVGQFVHAIRRNIRMLYLVENNGVYGLTKGQFSATADKGSRLKNGIVNELPPIDLCAIAIELGCSFVARSFSGDPRQMVPLIKAALSHRGLALLDVISPCVTFNDHEGSTKSHKVSRDSEIPLHGLGFVPHFEQINVDYEPGTVKEVTLHDGSKLLLKKIDRDYDPTDKLAAVQLLHKAKVEKQFLTGLLYVNEEAPNFNEVVGLPETPLSQLPESALKPSRAALDEIMAGLR